MSQLIALLAAATALAAAPPSENRTMPFPGKRTAWHGFDRYGFVVDGRPCCVVAPRQAAAARPWIWRARFFGHEPQTDIALLQRGFHLVYIDVANLFGSPKAVAHWDAFYKTLTEQHGFASKAVLEGMSRGGLIIFNWAAANPDKVAGIYADAPVCDFKSWPGGKGKSPGAPQAWRLCMQAYGFASEDEALAYDKNPIDNLAPLARARIPILSVCGADDKVVPVAENTAVVAERYKKLGGDIATIIKPNNGHHPHSLEDPAPIVDFILKHAPASR